MLRQIEFFCLIVFFEQVLADIELAQSIQKDKNEEDEKKKAAQAKPHPYDVNYGLLNCSLEHVDAKSEEFKVIVINLVLVLSIDDLILDN